jgi:hypothetical protein
MTRDYNFSKGLIAGLIIGIGISFVTFTFASNSIVQAYFNSNITIQSNGKTINTPVLSVQTDDGVTSTYLPLRKVAESIGAIVDWNSSTKTANIITNSEVPYMSDTTTNEITTTKIDTSELKYIEINGEKYINPIDLTIFCKKQGFSFSIGGLMESTTHYGIWSQDKNKTSALNGNVNIYRINKNAYFKYSFFTDTILPFMEKNK